MCESAGFHGRTELRAKENALSSLNLFIRIGRELIFARSGSALDDGKLSLVQERSFFR